MTASPGVMAAGAVLLAALIDHLLGDPLSWPHPVVVMGWWIQRLRWLVERWSGDSPWKLRCGGVAITVLLVAGSGLIGWGLERLALGHGGHTSPWINTLATALMVVGLASALAGRSLQQAVSTVLDALLKGDRPLARQRLQWIVGRDTADLDESGILRATAETAAENSVDGLFAPLFWMGVGVAFWSVNSHWPGPLCLAWAFKAASTLDSMLGYRRERLRWLGTAGARLDDALVWIPCRLVMVSLPLIARPWQQWGMLVRAAEKDGRRDPSPNAGRAEAIYAHCTGMRLGGLNRYKDRWIEKPVLAAAKPSADEQGVRRILRLTRQLAMTWLLIILVTAVVLNANQ